MWKKTLRVLFGTIHGKTFLLLFLAFWIASSSIEYFYLPLEIRLFYLFISMIVFFLGNYFQIVMIDVLNDDIKINLKAEQEDKYDMEAILNDPRYKVRGKREDGR